MRNGMRNFLILTVGMILSVNISALELSASIGTWERSDQDGNLVERIVNSSISELVLASNIEYFLEGKKTRGATGAFALIGGEMSATLYFGQGTVAYFTQISQNENSVTYKIKMSNGKESQTMWTRMLMIEQNGEQKMQQTIWDSAELNHVLSEDEFIKIL